LNKINTSLATEFVCVSMPQSLSCQWYLCCVYSSWRVKDQAELSIAKFGVILLLRIGYNHLLWRRLAMSWNVILFSTFWEYHVERHLREGMT